MFLNVEQLLFICPYNTDTILFCLNKQPLSYRVVSTIKNRFVSLVKELHQFTINKFSNSLGDFTRSDINLLQLSIVWVLYGSANLKLNNFCRQGSSWISNISRIRMTHAKHFKLNLTRVQCWWLVVMDLHGILVVKIHRIDEGDYCKAFSIFDHLG